MEKHMSMDGRKEIDRGGEENANTINRKKALKRHPSLWDHCFSVVE